MARTVSIGRQDFGKIRRHCARPRNGSTRRFLQQREFPLNEYGSTGLHFAVRRC